MFTYQIIFVIELVHENVERGICTLCENNNDAMYDGLGVPSNVQRMNNRVFLSEGFNELFFDLLSSENNNALFCGGGC